MVKKEEKGTWQLSVFSHNWMVNKTGLTLQYKAPDGFFNFVGFCVCPLLSSLYNSYSLPHSLNLYHHCRDKGIVIFIHINPNQL